MNLKQKLAKRRTGLRPNWDEHHAEKCSTINYFSDRENTELILLRQEIQIENSCINCGECEKCKNSKNTETNLEKWVFGHSTNTLGHGTFSIQTGQQKTVFLMKPS